MLSAIFCLLLAGAPSPARAVDVGTVAAPRSLVIRTKSVGGSSQNTSRGGIYVDTGGSGGGARLGGRGAGGFNYTQRGSFGASSSESHSSQSISASQFVRVVDGGQAFIQGPDTGLYVSPHVSGDRVTLKIATATASARGAGATSERTELSGKLGQWINIGGTDSTQFYLRVDSAP